MQLLVVNHILQLLFRNVILDVTDKKKLKIFLLCKSRQFDSTVRKQCISRANLFPLPLGVWEGLRFVIVALPGRFSYLFL